MCILDFDPIQLGRSLAFQTRVRPGLLLGLVLTLGSQLIAASPRNRSVPKTVDRAYRLQVRPLFERYCFACHGEKHKADIDLRGFTDAASVMGRHDLFERVLTQLRSSEMPPKAKPQPSEDERNLLIGWLDSAVFLVDCRHPDPGRVTVRRLNRVEYQNTIRDLLGVDFKAADDLPADDAGYGFDNIGDVLSLPPMLLEKYLEIAERVLAEASGTGGSTTPPASHTRIFYKLPGADDSPQLVARELIARFVGRAYRRPPEREEIDRLMQLFEVGRQQGEGFEASVRLALQAALVSPNFLFRGELKSGASAPDVSHPIDDFALASRLSYFLWSSMPDDALLELASRGRLRKELEKQVIRMLRDPKALALVDNFAGQWLQLRNLELMQPDAQVYPAFDAELRRAMRRETELLFERIVREDRSILEFLTADYTFVNGRLARHYGIPGVEGDEFRRVALAGTHRGGVLTHASVLTLTSNPTRTSPVKRGKWVLDNLLGTPPPPPPPGVPELDTSAQGALRGSLRQRMEQHRANPNCATCHERMDPIGFGLENFDGLGAWRTQDGTFDIDPAGRLASGEAFQGADALRSILATRKRQDFIRCLASKMLTYALGRGLEYYDRCAIDRIVEGVERQDARFSALILEIVKSPPFLLRRGEADASAGS